MRVNEKDVREALAEVQKTWPEIDLQCSYRKYRFVERMEKGGVLYLTGLISVREAWYWIVGCCHGKRHSAVKYNALTQKFSEELRNACKKSKSKRTGEGGEYSRCSAD